MPTEAVSIVVGADFTGAQAFAQARQATASLNPSIKEYATNAQLAGKAGRYLASSLGGGVFSQAAGEFGQMAGMAKNLANQLDGAGKYATLLKGAIGAVIAVGAIRLGVAIGTAIQDITSNWTAEVNQIKRDLEAMQHDFERMTSKMSKSSSFKLDMIATMPDDQKAAAYAKELEHLSKTLDMASRAAERNEAALREIDTAWNRTMHPDWIEDANQAWKNSVKVQHEVASAIDAVNDKAGERAKLLAEAKQAEQDRASVDAILKGLNAQTDALAYNKRELLELELIRKHATDEQRKEAFAAFDAAEAATEQIERELQARKALLNVQEEAAAVVARNKEENDAAAQQLDDYMQGLAEQLANVGKSAGDIAADEAEKLGGGPQEQDDARQLADDRERLAAAKALADSNKATIDQTLKGLQDELDRVQLTRAEYEKKQLAAAGAGTTEQAQAAQLLLDIEKAEAAKKAQADADKAKNKQAKKEKDDFKRLDAAEGRFLTLRRDTDATRDVANNTSKLLAMIPGLTKLNASAATIANNTRNQIGLVP